MTDGSGFGRGPWFSNRPGAWLAAAVVLAGLSLVLFVNLGVEPPGRISEARCKNVARRMVLSGDWLVPRLGAKIRLAKPPLFYWVGATTGKLLDDTDRIAVRLPSALAGVALAALVMVWASTLGGSWAGPAAGAALAATVQFFASGRRGDAEMLLALLCTATLFVFDRIHVANRRALLPLFGVLAGLALLTKATAVILIVALPILAFLALQGELRRLRDPGALATCGLALAIGLSWYVAILALVPDAFEMLWNELLTPLGAAPAHSGDATHFRPFWWYLTVLPVRSAPASLLLPLVVWRLWTTGVYRGEPRLRFAALTFLAPFVAFSLLPQKQNHYTLAMLPGLALITAEAVGAIAPRARAWLGRIIGTPLALAGMAGTVVLALFFLWIEGRPAIVVASGAALLCTLFAVALVAAVRGRAAGFALAWIPAFLLVFATHRSIAVVRAEQLKESGLSGLTVDEKERLYRVAREQPWMIKLFQIAPGALTDD